jgi:hypothetical protein
MFRLDPPIAIGPDNDHWIHSSTRHAAATVAAWGECKPAFRGVYDARIAAVMAEVGAARLSVVGELTKHGYPRRAPMEPEPDVAPLGQRLDTTRRTDPRPVGVEHQASIMSGL